MSIENNIHCSYTHSTNEMDFLTNGFFNRRGNFGEIDSTQSKGENKQGF